MASFGGIVGVNRELDGATAREIAANSYEAVVAPGFSQAALGILKAKAGLELLAVPPDPTDGMRDYGIANLDFKRVAGGLLVEDLDDLGLDRGQLQVVTRRRPTLEELTDLLFAWRAVRHVRSNAIVLARNGATVGIGAGQASRQVSVEIALRRAGDRAKTAVMAVGRVLPVPGRDPGGGDGGRHGDHPARRLHPRRDGHRGRRPTPPGDGVHRPTALPALIRDERGTAHGAAARAGDGPRHGGRGDRVGAVHGTGRASDEADAAATTAMRSTMDEIEFAGRIVIGEGERDEAPMLYIGERVGKTGADRAEVPAIDIAVDPLEGTNLVAHGQAGAITVLCAVGGGRPDQRPRHLHGEAVRRPGRRRQGRHPGQPDREPRAHRRGARPQGRRTSRSSSSSGPATTTSSPRSAPPAPGSSSSATATCPRRSRAPCRAPASTP